MGVSFFKKTSFFIFAAGCICAVFTADVNAQEVIAQLNDQDRILVLAPHPDDEAIGAAGVIQSAMSRLLPVKVVYLTHGDANELSFLVYEKRLVLRRNSVLSMGRLRQSEAAAAMESLGLSHEDLIFLGYPDAGTLTIFQQHWGVTTLPYKSFWTRVRSVPYKNSYSYGAPYVGESILRDLKKILLDFKPTRIFVSHPMDNNADHRAFYLFLKIALWDLGQKIPAPEVYPYLIHENDWPMPRGFNPELPLKPSEKLQFSEIRWLSLPLTTAQIQKKRDTIDFYKSQIEYNPPYLFSFARRNELFGDYPPILIKNHPEGPIDWQNVELSQKITTTHIDTENNVNPLLDSLSYARQGKFLYIKLQSLSWNDKLLGIHLNLFGYRRGLPFSNMPKYQLKVTFSKFVAVYEKGRRVFIKNMEVNRSGKTVIIKFPLESMENPHYILSSAKAQMNDTDIDRTAWRVLLLE